MFQDRLYFKRLFQIALPIIAQNFISSSLNLIDVTMLGQLGETAVASVGLANQVFFLLTLMLFGTYSGVGVFTAQLWGKNDLVGVRKVLGIGLLIGLSGSLVFTLLALVIPAQVMGLYTADPSVIAAGTMYLRIVGWTYALTAVSFAYSSVLRGTGFVRVPMMVSMVALSLKTLLNFGLIFGNFGLPKLGIEGAAIASIIARLLETGALLTITYWRKLPAAAHFRELFGFERAFFLKVINISLPVVVNETLWSLGVTVYTMVYGHIGTSAIAAVNIVASIENLAYVIFLGISDATGIMIGNRIGADEEHLAMVYARRTLIITTTLAVVLGGLILIGRPYILRLYQLTPESLQNAYDILTVVGFALWIRTTNMILIVGVLRAGGDTRFCLVLDAGSVWLVGVPLALLGGLVLHLPVSTVYLMVVSEELVKYGVAMWRFRSGRWITNLARAV